MVSLASIDKAESNSVDSPSGSSGQDRQVKAVAPERSKYAEFLADAVVQSRSDLEVSRQVYGKRPCYVLRDSVSFQSRSLSSRDYRVFSAIDGTQTCAVVFDHLVEAGVLDRGDEEEYYGFLLSLHQRGLLNLPIANGKALYERYKTRQRRARSGWIFKLLCWKISFGNPDAWLSRITGPLKHLLSLPALIIWLVAGGFAINVVCQRWSEFATPVASMLAIQNIATVMVILVLLKIWHEIGHAVATKGWGGEVPDYGVLMILGTPCAYVDASSAWMMPSRRKRIIISAAGMYFESIIAIVAGAVWAFTNDPLTKSLAHHTIFLSTLTTLLFNANPLMKFDGYFILSDALDIPNLKSRADEAFRWFAKKYLLGLKINRLSGKLSANFALAAFGAASGIYRVLIISGIVAILTWRLPLGGLWLAAAYLIFTLAQQTIVVIRYLWTHPETLEHRRQAWLISIFAIVMVSIASCWPFEQNVSTLAVTEFAGESFVRSKADGTIIAIHANEGDQVKVDQILVELESPDLQQRVEQLAAEIDARHLHYRRAIVNGSKDAEQLRTEWLSTKSEWHRLTRKKDDLQIRADQAGVITEWNGDFEIGKRLADGEVFAQIGTGQAVVRTLLRQHKRQSILPQLGEKVWITFPWDLKQRYPAHVSRITQASTEHIRETALTSMAGGEIEVDPMEMKPLEDVYVVEAEFVAPPTEAMRRGLRAQITFEGRRKSIAQWIWYRWLDFYRRYHLAV